MLSLCKLFAQVFQIGSPGRHVRVRPRLGIESLEDRCLLSSTLQAITLANTALPASSAALGISNNPSVSADGRFVAYESTATNLVAGQNNPTITDNVFLFDRQTGTNLLVSHRFGSTTQGGNQSSYDAIISGNGQFVYYLSEATNLIQGVPAGFGGQDLYVYNTADQSTRLVTHNYLVANQPGSGSTGLVYLGEATGAPMSVSFSGTLVTYASEATDLVPNMTGAIGFQHPNVFVYNYNTGAAGTNTLVSAQYNNFSLALGGVEPVISAGGGYIAFISSSGPFVANEDPQFSLAPPTFPTPIVAAGGSGYSVGNVLTVQGGAFTTPAQFTVTAIGAGGAVTGATLSQAGLYSGLSGPPPVSVTGGTGSGAKFNVSVVVPFNLYLYNVASATTILLSSHYGTTTETANARSDTPVIVQIGSTAFVAFRSDATDLVNGQTGAAGNIFLYDSTANMLGLVTGANQSLTQGSGGNPFVFQIGGQPLSMAPAGNGVDIVYQSQAANLLFFQPPNRPGVTSNVYLWTFGAVQLGTITGFNQMVSTNFAGQEGFANGNSTQPVISSDGSTLVFESAATNLVPSQSGPATLNVFTIPVATVIANGGPNPYVPPTLVSGHNGSGTITANAASESGDLDSGSFSFYVSPFGISSNGSFLTFVSTATDLSTAIFKANANLDVFEYIGGMPSSLTLVSHSATQAATAGGNSYVTSVSGDDNYSVFVSDAINLVAGQQNTHYGLNIFVRDNLQRNVTLVNHLPGSTVTTGDTGIPEQPFTPDPTDGIFTPPPPSASELPVISADGNFIAFVSNDTNLVNGQSGPSGHNNVFVFNRLTGAIILVSGVNGSATVTGAYDSNSPAISSNGEFVTFVSNGVVYLFDTNLLHLTQVSAAGSSPSISDDGRFVAYLNQGNVYVFDRSHGTSTLVSHTAGSLTTAANGASGAVLSHDGSAIAFVSNAANVVAGQTASGTAGLTNVFLYKNDGSGAISLVSGVNGSATLTGNNNSDSPAIDGDGSYVAYRSDATNLISGTISGSNVYEFNTQARTQTLVSAAAGSTTTAAAGNSTQPGIDDDGHLVVFLSTATNLVAGQVGGGTNNVFLWSRPLGQAFLVSGQGGSITVASAGSAVLPIISRHSFPYFTSEAVDLIAATGATNNGYVNLLGQVTLSLNTVPNGAAAGTLVGTLTVTSSFFGGFFVTQYGLPTGGADDADNALFSLGLSTGREALFTGFVANAAVQPFYHVSLDVDIGFGDDLVPLTIAVAPALPPPPPPALSFLATAGNGTVVARLPGYGVWRFEDAAGWRQLTASAATEVAVDAGGDVVALLGSAGVWRFEDARGWQQLTASTTLEVGIADTGIVTALIAGAGVWRFEDAGGWRQLTATAATSVGVDAHGDVVAAIVNAGVWRYEDARGWQQLTASTPTQVSIAGNGYVEMTFQGAGVWRWEDASGWLQLTQSSASSVSIDDQGDLVALLAGAGVWRWEDAAGWQDLTSTNATQVDIGGNGNVVAELPGAGIWRFENVGGWRQLTATDAG